LWNLAVKKYNAKYSLWFSRRWEKKLYFHKTPMPTSDKGVNKPKHHPALAALQKQQNLK
jgi:hypothetical protein